MVLGLIDQLQIYLLTVVSDIIARAFNRPGATRAAALDISKAFDRTNSGLMEYQVRYLALFFFSVLGGFRLFWMGSVYKNIQLMLEFLKSPL